MKNILRGVGLPVILTMVAVGCGQDEGKASKERRIKKAIESAYASSGQRVDAQVDASGETVAVSLTLKGGTELNVLNSARLLDDFQKDVPVYLDMKLRGCSRVEQDELFVVCGTTPDSPDRVIPFFKKEAAANGWRERSPMTETGRERNFVCTKDERYFRVTVSLQDGSTMIVVNTGPEQRRGA